MVAIEAEEHPLGAADLHLLCQELLVDAAGVVGRVESLGELGGEGIERDRRSLGAPLPGRQQVVCRDPVDPGAERRLAAESAAAQVGDDLDQDLLGCVSASAGCQSIRIARP